MEISTQIHAPTVIVTIPDGIQLGELDLHPTPGGSYRLRFHARGRDAGTEAEFISADDGQDMVEEHLVLIWPAPNPD
ncbi:hypothetical protein amrb99_95460 [Actinomadura sp. RB99]|uniref:hypothetical protein n=1 Tax=Actinomadura sp. RB99 TaxID=2691577 RepID=UPI001687A5BD|nr:hypothetical protein [Actinomadura sp. RB99]MBD2900541.1 hypothetical protein [Actinomadura sp. RB99]